MADQSLFAGPALRRLRKREALTQGAMANRLDISASYLNLIEHDKRPLSATLLIKLSEIFDVDVRSFAKGADQQLRNDLIYRVSFLSHLKESFPGLRPDRILSLQLDQF